MITLFGKLRYHWQPDLSWLIIYWSIACTPIFIGLSLLLEKSQVTFTIFALFCLFLLLALIGFHRYFLIGEKDLSIASANLFRTKKIAISSIEKIEVTSLSIRLLTTDCPEGKTYHMRKWPKKYFVNALALHEEFKGEVDLVDHLLKLDYFEEYYSDRAKSVG